MKKTILPIFLVLILALSISAVSADESLSVDNTLSSTDTNEPIAEDSVPEQVSVSENDAQVVQNLVDNADEGATVDLESGRTYNVNGTNINVTKAITIDGHGATITASGKNQSGVGATMVLFKSGITLKNIIFKNIDPLASYGQTVSGYAVSTEGDIEDMTIENCSFLNFNSGFQSNGVSFSTISNCTFTGSTTKVTNDGKKETGTKAINLKGSHNLTIIGCIFDGQVLDGLSIAGDSGNILVKNNTFRNNCYAIYFGGASTQGTTVIDNIFDNCGYVVDANSVRLFTNLPVISTQKSCNGFTITNNKFYTIDGSILIKCESGNTAHGYPSIMGDVNITDNTVELAQGVSSLTKNTIFVDILSNKGPLSPYAPISILGNTIAEGMVLVNVTLNSTNELPNSINGTEVSSTPCYVWYNSWNVTNGVVIPAVEKVASAINIVDVSTTNGTITIQLIDPSKGGMAGKISYMINGVEQKPVATNAQGFLTIDVPSNGLVSFAYAGDNTYKSSTANIVFAKSEEKVVQKVVEKVVEKAPAPQVTKLVAKQKTFKRKATKKFSVTLKNNKGKVIKGKYVSFKIGKTTYVAKTNAKGVATVSVKLTKKGKYTVKIVFDGDAGYKKASTSAKIIIK